MNKEAQISIYLLKKKFDIDELSWLYFCNVYESTIDPIQISKKDDVTKGGSYVSSTSPVLEYARKYSP